MSQLTTKNIGNNQVDDTKVRLRNDQSLRSRNNAGSGDVDILKVNTSDKVDFNANQLTNVSDPTNPQDVATKNYVDNATGTVPGDIPLTSFTAADNQSSPADITGLVFANGTTRSFDVTLSIVRDTTYSSYKLYGIQKGSSWEMSQNFTGDVTGIVLTITTSGQIQYTSTNTGFTATVKFRAITTTV